MKELEAINMMLRAIGSSPVNDIDTPHPDAANAKATLRRKAREAQKRGWWFNIDYNVLYYPNFNNEIILSEDILSMALTDSTIIKRGLKLYDSVNNTYKFKEPIEIHRSVRALPWNEIPESMQEHIQYLAAAEFVRDEIEDNAKAQSLREDAGIAMINVKKEDLETSQFNSFNKSRVLRARGGVNPYSRGNRRFSGDPDR